MAVEGAEERGCKQAVLFGREKLVSDTARHKRERKQEGERSQSDWTKTCKENHEGFQSKVSREETIVGVSLTIPTCVAGSVSVCSEKGKSCSKELMGRVKYFGTRKKGLESANMGMEVSQIQPRSVRGRRSEGERITSFKSNTDSLSP